MVVAKGFLPSDEIVRTKVLDERSMLGREALIEFAGDVLANMQKKGAFSLEALASAASGKPAATSNE